MFDAQLYYKYINTIQNTNTLIYIIILLIAVGVGIAMGIPTLIITIPIGILIANIYTFNSKIKIEKMKWEIDIYNKMNQK